MLCKLLIKQNTIICKCNIQLDTEQRLYLMLKLINFINMCKYMLILNLMATTSFKEVGIGATKYWESSMMLKGGSVLHKQG